MLIVAPICWSMMEPLRPSALRTILVRIVAPATGFVCRGAKAVRGAPVAHVETEVESLTVRHEVFREVLLEPWPTEVIARQIGREPSRLEPLQVDPADDL